MSQTGQVLAEERKKQGKRVSDIAAATHIRQEFIKAIEEDRIDLLPDRSYARYFIKDYAEYLGLDPKPFLNKIRTNNEKNISEKIPLAVLSSFERKRRQKLRRWAWGLVSVIVALFIIGIANWKWAERPGPQLLVSRESSSNEIAKKEPLKKLSEIKPADVKPELTQQPKVSIRLWVSNQPSWMEVKSDNKVIYQGILPPGAQREWSGKEKVEIKVGNAGAVHIQVNNQDLGVLGKYREVVRKTFTIDSM